MGIESGKLKRSDLSFSNLTEIRAVALRCFPSTWSESEFAFFLKNECGYHRGFREGESLVSYLVALLVQGELDVISIATAPEYRMQGLAGLLMREAQANSKITGIHLEVDVENAAAVKLYEKMGFTITRTRKKYYSGLRDAFEMQWRRS